MTVPIAVISQTLYNQSGIRLDYTTAPTKQVYCNKEGKTVYFVRFRYTVSNNSGKPARINSYIEMCSDAFASCLSEDDCFDYEARHRCDFQDGRYLILQSGQSYSGEVGDWYYQPSALPCSWWVNPEFPKAGTTLKINVDLSGHNTVKKPVKPAYGIAQTGDVINNPKPGQGYIPPTRDPVAKTFLQPRASQTVGNQTANRNAGTYGISQQGDVINNPKPVVDYAAKQQAIDKATDNAMKAWKNSSTEGQKQMNLMNQMMQPNQSAASASQAAGQRQLQLQQQQEMLRQQQQAARQRTERLQREMAEQQRRMGQMQLDLASAQSASMNAYQQAIDNGRRESGAMVEATLAGAQQFSDKQAGMIYTGVGLGISLFMHLSEKKEDRHQQRLAIQKEMERRQLIIDTKSKYIEEALQINKYDVADLAFKDRYAAVLVVPDELDTLQQPIFFSYPLQVQKYADGSYPLKPEIENKMAAVIDKNIQLHHTVYTLYPISQLDLFVSDFVKKMGSGDIIQLNAHIMNFQRNPFQFDKLPASTSDFWEQPATGSVKPASDSTIKKKDFWNQ